MTKNKATVTDGNLQDAFLGGFNEARDVTGDAVKYVVTLIFEGNRLNVRDFDDLDAALDFAEQHLISGAEAEVQIRCVMKATPAQPQAQAVEAGDDDIEEAEIVG